ncbi:MAG: SRPBCC domain-containing protein [Cohnella sp.]|nr:SRPBCC domain-containing protein [Cohnella sp.]
MSEQSYTMTFEAGQTPDEVFAAINNVRGWWSGEIEGETGRPGAEFTYRVPGIHYCKMRITEFVPGRKIVWRVLDSDISYTEAKNEWNDTSITFDISPKDGMTEIRFTHVGLVPSDECYGNCSNGWNLLVGGNLRKLIATGFDQPSPFAKLA